MNIKINLINFEWKPLEKLFEVVGKWLGTVYRPTSIRKEADAKAYEIEVIERAKAKSQVEWNEIRLEWHLRIQERLEGKENKRQNNIDTTVAIAAEKILLSQKISDKEVSEDWATRFFNIAQDISDEEVQLLWGRILAGEIQNPKTYSLRTLELLKNLSKEEALLLVKIGNLALFEKWRYFIFNPDNWKYLKDNYWITFTDLLLLREIGILAPSDNAALNIEESENTTTNFFNYGNLKAIQIKRLPGAPKKSIPVILFSSSATELLKLINREVDINYINKFVDFLKSDLTDIQVLDIV